MREDSEENEKGMRLINWSLEHHRVPIGTRVV